MLVESLERSNYPGFFGRVARTKGRNQGVHGVNFMNFREAAA
ncbi:MAG TPA: hypothetical protein VL100_09065 [Croceibacterium sp.]|nr:hypothetical protein [Croceibacterium sp.]